MGSCLVPGHSRRPRSDRAEHPALKRARQKLASRDDSGAALIIALVFVVVGALALVSLVTFAGSALLDTAQLKSVRAVQYAAVGATDIAVQAVRYSPNAFDKPTLGPVTPPQNCLGTTSVPINGYRMSVDCSGSQGHLEAFGEGTFAIGSKIMGSPVTTVLITGTATYVGWEVISKAVPSSPPTMITSETNAAHTALLSAMATLTGTQTIVLVPPQQRIVNFYACLATTGTCTSSHFLVHAVINFSDVSAAGYECSASTTKTCGTSMVIEQWIVDR